MTLLDPLSIPLTHTAFKAWMLDAGDELKRLDAKYYEVLTEYWRRGNTARAEIQREQDCFDVWFELLGLKLATEAVWALWKQLRAEMD